jgi:putative ATP-dependent endonuclease of OLD family
MQAPLGSGKAQPLYPDLMDVVPVSDNTAKAKAAEDALVKVFHGVKTFEYDLALHGDNRTAMISALKDIHPTIGASVEVEVDAAVGDAAKAKALFRGMFERESNNVQKGRFGQALAQTIADPATHFIVPDYILRAINHACQLAPAPA